MSSKRKLQSLYPRYQPTAYEIQYGKKYKAFNALKQLVQEKKRKAAIVAAKHKRRVKYFVFRKMYNKWRHKSLNRAMAQMKHNVYTRRLVREYPKK